MTLVMRLNLSLHIQMIAVPLNWPLWETWAFTKGGEHQLNDVACTVPMRGLGMAGLKHLPAAHLSTFQAPSTRPPQ